LREDLHVLENGAQLDGGSARLLVTDAEPSERSDVTHFVE
jgi:hypothetical protein